MSEAVPEQRAESDLPPVVPAEFFDNPFHSQVATIWWINPKLTTLREALPAVLDTMSPAELFKFGRKLEEDYIELGDCDHITSIWGIPSELNVDEEGVIRGVFGHVQAVKDYVQNGIKEHSYSATQAVNAIEDEIQMGLYEAAVRWQGTEFADELFEKVDIEGYRRLELRSSLALS
ncbi:MAG TPA: hypothetical protein VG992_00570 [Candidatus Saccharimonadales bacterium]|nr:hypothetical protein [Candidatus Saccharimonadales bacterium]